MSAGEEEEHGMEAIIKALTKALTDIKGSPTDSLKPPTFDWNSSEQFEDFRLFIKGMESWYTLQGIPDKDGDRDILGMFHVSHIIHNLSCPIRDNPRNVTHVPCHGILYTVCPVPLSH